MLKLYYAPGACSLSVHIALEWTGKPYEKVQVDPHDPDYKRVNPAGAVPALDHGGAEPLTQCAAILTYIGLTHPELELLDHASPARTAEVERWSAYFTGDLHPAFGPVFAPQRFTTSSDEAELARVKAAGLALVRARLALLDQQLKGRAYITGEQRRYVDAYSVPMVRWASAMLPGGLAEFAEVRRHHEHMLSDPGVRRAMEQEGLLKS